MVEARRRRAGQRRILSFFPLCREKRARRPRSSLSGSPFMPPALFLALFYPCYLALVVLSLLASLQAVLSSAASSPAAIVRGLVA